MWDIKKIIKFISVISLSFTIAACSSGSSDSAQGVNLTGAWSGTITTTSGTSHAVTMQISQPNSVAVGVDKVELDLLVTAVLPTTGTACTVTLGIEGATLNRQAGTLVSTESEFLFNAQVTNTSITGQAFVEASSDQETAGCSALVGTLSLSRA